MQQVQPLWLKQFFKNLEETVIESSVINTVNQSSIRLVQNQEFAKRKLNGHHFNSTITLKL